MYAPQQNIHELRLASLTLINWLLALALLGIVGVTPLRSGSVRYPRLSGRLFGCACADPNTVSLVHRDPDLPYIGFWSTLSGDFGFCD